MPGTTYDISLTGNVSKVALDGAQSIDTLTAALKAEQKALDGTRTAFARMQAGSKVDLAVVARAKEGAGRIAQLKQQIANARAAGERPTRLGFIEAIEKSGGPIGGLIKNIKAAWEALKANPSAAVAVAFAGLTVAAVSLGSKLLGLAKDAITLGVGFADSARSARLLNEAADIAGGTHKQLSGIIEDVRRKSDIGRDVLSGYGRELRTLGFDSRQTQIVLRAMAVAESALGSAAAGGVKGIAEQSRAFRRLTLGARDAYGEYASLRAIGLRKADLFAELSRGTGRSVAEVQRMVGAGKISVKAGMAAIEAALQRKFGGTVQAQSRSITSQFRRMREDFEGLFSGADIEPLLAGLRSITTIFSQDTAAGQSFKKVVTGLLSDLGKTAEELGPTIKEAILGLAADAAKPGGLATTIRGWIQDAKELGSAISSIAEAIKAIGSAAKAIAHPLDTFVDKFTYKGPQNTGIKYEAIDVGVAEGQGLAITAGIAKGIEAGTGKPVTAIQAMAAAMKTAFDQANQIKSPSRVYEKQATHIPTGAARGVQKATPIATEAIVDMSAKMRGGFSVPPSGSIGGDTYSFTANFMGNTQANPELERQVRAWVYSSIQMATGRGPQTVTG